MKDISIYGQQGERVLIKDDDTAIVMHNTPDSYIINRVLEMRDEMNRMPLTVRAPRDIGTAIFQAYIAKGFDNPVVVTKFDDDGTMYSVVDGTHCLIGVDDSSAYFVYMELA